MLRIALTVFLLLVTAPTLAGNCRTDQDCSGGRCLFYQGRAATRNLERGVCYPAHCFNGAQDAEVELGIDCGANCRRPCTPKCNPDTDPVDDPAIPGWLRDISGLPRLDDCVEGGETLIQYFCDAKQEAVALVTPCTARGGIPHHCQLRDVVAQGGGTLGIGACTPVDRAPAACREIGYNGGSPDNGDDPDHVGAVQEANGNISADACVGNTLVEYYCASDASNPSGPIRRQTHLYPDHMSCIALPEGADQCTRRHTPVPNCPAWLVGEDCCNAEQQGTLPACLQVVSTTIQQAFTQCLRENGLEPAPDGGPPGGGGDPRNQSSPCRSQNQGGGSGSSGNTAPPGVSGAEYGLLGRIEDAWTIAQRKKKVEICFRREINKSQAPIEQCCSERVTVEDSCLGEAHAGKPIGERINHGDRRLDGDGEFVCPFIDNCLLYNNPDQVDGDSDGFGNVCDTCPTRANPDQQDRDGDGVGDACDNCQQSSNPGQQDTDRDGRGDSCDNCRNVSNPFQQDADRDGIGDVCDNCPSLANPDQRDANRNGVGDSCDGTKLKGQPMPPAKNQHKKAGQK